MGLFSHIPDLDSVKASALQTPNKIQPIPIPKPAHLTFASVPKPLNNLPERRTFKLSEPNLSQFPSPKLSRAPSKLHCDIELSLYPKFSSSKLASLGDTLIPNCLLSKLFFNFPKDIIFALFQVPVIQNPLNVTVFTPENNLSPDIIQHFPHPLILVYNNHFRAFPHLLVDILDFLLKRLIFNSPILISQIPHSQTIQVHFTSTSSKNFSP